MALIISDIARHVSSSPFNLHEVEQNFVSVFSESVRFSVTWQVLNKLPPTGKQSKVDKMTISSTYLFHYFTSLHILVLEFTKSVIYADAHMEYFVYIIKMFSPLNQRIILEVKGSVAILPISLGSFFYMEESRR